MKRSIKLILCLVLFSSANAHGFVARIIDQNKKSCMEDVDTNVPIGCLASNNNFKESIGFQSSVTSLNASMDQIGDLLIPLEFAREQSGHIVKQVDKNTTELKGLEKQLQVNEGERLENLREHLAVVSALEYRLEIMEKSLSKCVDTRSKSKESFNKCQAKREEHLAPFKAQLNQEYLRFPLLKEASIQEDIKNKVEKKLSGDDGYLVQIKALEASKRNCQRRNRRIRNANSKKDCDLAFDSDREKIQQEMNDDIFFERDEESENQLLANAIDKSLESLNETKERHESVALEVEQGLLNFGEHGTVNGRTGRRGESLESLYNRLFRGTSSEHLNLLTDYSLSFDPNKVEQDPVYKYASCRLLKEKNANDLNEQIKSYSLDVATILIPVGGAYALSAKALSRLAKSRGMILGGAEAAAAGADLGLLNRRSNFCAEVEKKSLSVSNSNQSFDQTLAECKATLDNQTLSTSLALLGGAAGTMVEVFSKGSRLEGIPLQDIEKRRTLAANALETDIDLDQALAVEKAHLVGRGDLGKDGVNPAGVGNYTKEQLLAKDRILKAAGFSKKQRRELIEAEVVGDKQVAGVMSKLKNVFKKEPPKATPQLSQRDIKVGQVSNELFVENLKRSPLSETEEVFVQKEIFERNLPESIRSKAGVLVESDGSVQISQRNLDRLSDAELDELNSFLKDWNNASAKLASSGSMTEAERIQLLSNRFKIKDEQVRAPSESVAQKIETSAPRPVPTPTNSAPQSNSFVESRVRDTLGAKNPKIADAFFNKASVERREAIEQTIRDNHSAQGITKEDGIVFFGDHNIHEGAIQSAKELKREFEKAGEDVIVISGHGGAKEGTFLFGKDRKPATEANGREITVMDNAWGGAEMLDVLSRLGYDVADKNKKIVFSTCHGGSAQGLSKIGIQATVACHKKSVIHSSSRQVIFRPDSSVHKENELPDSAPVSGEFGPNSDAAIEFREGIPSGL